MDDKYNVVFRGNLVPGYTPDAVKKNLSRIFKTSEVQIAKLLSAPSCAIGKNMDRQSAEKYRRVLKKGGAVCLLERVEKPSESPSEKQPSKKTPPVAKEELQSGARTYDIVFDGKLLQGFDLYSAKQNLAKALHLDFKQVHDLLSPRPSIIKAGLQDAPARKVKALMEEAGARCRIVPKGSVASGKPPEAGRRPGTHGRRIRQTAVPSRNPNPKSHLPRLRPKGLQANHPNSP